MKDLPLIFVSVAMWIATVTAQYYLAMKLRRTNRNTQANADLKDWTRLVMLVNSLVYGACAGALVGLFCSIDCTVWLVLVAGFIGITSAGALCATMAIVMECDREINDHFHTVIFTYLASPALYIIMYMFVKIIRYPSSFKTLPVSDSVAIISLVPTIITAFISLGFHKKKPAR